MLSATMVRRLLIVTFFIVRVLVLIELFRSKAFDWTYYTYLSFFGATLVYGVGVVALFVPTLMRVYATFLFPLLVQNTLLVCVLIVVIVHLNPAIFESHALPFGGTMTVGELHTGDFIVHYFPCLDTLVTLLALHHVARHNVRELWLRAGVVGRTLLVAYYCLGALVPMALYSLVADWQTKYETPLSPFLGWLVIVAASVVVGGLIFCFFISTHDIEYGALSVYTTTTASIKTYNAYDNASDSGAFYVGQDALQHGGVRAREEARTSAKRAKPRLGYEL
jgi:hypothetical protein